MLHRFFAALVAMLSFVAMPAIGAPIIDPATVSALSLSKYRIENNLGNVRVIIAGDSTSAHTDTWGYAFAADLGTKYPDHSVTWSLWNDTTGAYDAATTLQTGTAGAGSATIQFFSASVAGFNLINWSGSRFTPAIESISDPALLIINAGINVNGASRAAIRGSYFDFLTQISTRLPNVPIAMHLQQPLQNANDMAKVIAAQRDVVQVMPSISLIDTYDAIIAAGKPLSYYKTGDNTHLSPIGNAVAEAAWSAAWDAASDVPAPGDGRDRWFASAQALDLLHNGSFSDWAGLVPASWTLGGTGVLAKDTVDHYTAKGYSAKLTSSATARLTQAFDATQLTVARGHMIGVVVRVKIDAGSASTYAGALYVTTNTAAVDTFHWNAGDGAGGYRIAIIDGFYVPFDATSVTVSVYASADANAATIRVDEVHAYLADRGRPIGLLPANL